MADVGALMEVGMSDAYDQDGSDYGSMYYHDEAYGGDTSQLGLLRRNCTCDDALQRQLASKSVNYVAKSLQLESEFQMLLQIVNHLSNDSEAGVCVELMERLPELCLILLESGVVPFAIQNYILPIIVKYLGDDSNDVRRLAHNGLLKLVDNNIIGKDDIEKHVCDVLLQLSEVGNNEEFRTESVAMITKLAPYVGKDLTMRMFFNPFQELCGDDAFLIRKMCAMNFTDIASVVDFDTAEKLFLPLFNQLCLDGVWGVRKACAESFPSLSSCFSREVRFHSLAALFANFFDDPSRWVQMAAYQSLGQFVSTFSDPSLSGFELSIDGVLIPYNGPMEDEQSNSSKISSETCESKSEKECDAPPSEEEKPTDSVLNENEKEVSKEQEKTPSKDDERLSVEELNDNESAEDKCSAVEDGLKAEETALSCHSLEEHHTVDRLTEFDSFVYWKTPIPDVDVPDDLLTNDDADADDEDIDELRQDLLSLNVTPVDPFKSKSSGGMDTYDFGWSLSNNFRKEFSGQDLGDSYNSDRHSFSEDMPDLVQDVIPPAILYHYISMTKSSKASMIDTDIALHCAYTFPGVVLTLGRRNWHCLKETYKQLAQNMQWKVRRTLAFSIHHLALILGEEITVSDLMPVFNEFLKDLDEVRIGVLKHLYDFVSLLPIESQREYLSTYAKFLNSDNSRNWRFRQELARQLILLSGLYDVEEINDYFVPIALALAIDHVAEVRSISFNVLSVILGMLRDSNQPAFVRKFVAEIVGLCTFHQHWVKRKSCAHACLTFLQHNVEQPEMFAEDFLPGLLTLASDPVPNVRLIAAKALSRFILSEFFKSLPEKDDTRVLVETHMRQLQIDEDRDVRYFSGGNRDLHPIGSRKGSDADTTSNHESDPSSPGTATNPNRNLVVVVQDSTRRNLSHSVSISSGGKSTASPDSITEDRDDNDQQPLSSPPPSIQIVGCGHRSVTISNKSIDSTTDNVRQPSDKSVLVEEVVSTYETADDDDEFQPGPGEEIVVEEIVEEIVEEYEET